MPWQVARLLPKLKRPKSRNNMLLKSITNDRLNYSHSHYLLFHLKCGTIDSRSINITVADLRKNNIKLSLLLSTIRKWCNMLCYYTQVVKIMFFLTQL